MREFIFNKSIRPDGRKPDEIRKINCEIGCSLTRLMVRDYLQGEDTSLILALGSMKEAQKIEGIDNEEFKRFMHHYNFPAYSTGEIDCI